MHFHSAKLWSHPLRVLCTCILSTRTIRKPQQREKNKYDGEGRERERERKERRKKRGKESLRRIEIGFAKSFPVFAKCLVHDKWGFAMKAG